MTSGKLRVGAIGGLIGGLAMGMWMMISYWATARGFWRPLGYIGHFFLRNPDIDDPSQIFVGAIVHMTVSVALGVAIASVLPRAYPLAASVGALLIALAVWAFMQYIVLRALDQTAYFGLTPWAFAIGHLIYGWIVGVAVSAPRRRVSAARRPSANESRLFSQSR